MKIRMRVLFVVCIALAFALTDVHGTRQATSGKLLPPLKRQATPKAVVDEHLDALNRCDWTRLMAQYPTDVEIFLPGGQVVKGRRAVGDLFEGFRSEERRVGKEWGSRWWSCRYR